MENETTNILNKIASNERFYGSVPKELEVTVTAACLGAPIQYQVGKITGLTDVCMPVPTENGGTQPVIVTYGKEESLGNGAYQAIYNQLHCESLINVKSDVEAANILIKAFDARFGLGNGNDYLSKILDPRFAVLENKSKTNYPEYAQLLKNFRSVYTNEFNAYYSGNKIKDEEKKTNNAAMTGVGTQIPTQINA